MYWITSMICPTQHPHVWKHEYNAPCTINPHNEGLFPSLNGSTFVSMIQACIFTFFLVLTLKVIITSIDSTSWNISDDSLLFYISNLYSNFWIYWDLSKNFLIPSFKQSNPFFSPWHLKLLKLIIYFFSACLHLPLISLKSYIRPDSFRLTTLMPVGPGKPQLVWGIGHRGVHARSLWPCVCI